MNILRAIFGGGYAKGSAMLTSDFVRAQLEAVPCLAGAEIFLKDGDYLGLEAGRLQDFLADKVWTPGLKYKPEVFDCDDFAACARADVLRAGSAEGFKRALFIAEVCHYPVTGAYHDALLVMDAAGVLWLYEPQNGSMTKDLPSKIREAVEIWG